MLVLFGLLVLLLLEFVVGMTTLVLLGLVELVLDI